MKNRGKKGINSINEIKTTVDDNTIYGNSEGAYATRCWIPFKTDESTEIWANKPPLELWVYSNKDDTKFVFILHA